MKKLLSSFLTITILCTSLSVQSFAFTWPFGKDKEASSSSSAPSSSQTSPSSSGEKKDKNSSSSAPVRTPSKESSKDENASGSSSKDATSKEASSKNSSAKENPGKPSAATPGASGGTGISSVIMPPDFADTLLSQGIYMMNVDSGMVVFEKNAHEKIKPASLAKIMTCIVALEQVADIDTESTDLKAYIQNYLYNLGGASVGGIYLGETLSIHDLLYSMMLQSACEAAMMIADYVGSGNQDAFCDLMNKKAKEIGANNTHFGDAAGLDTDNSYTTAYDMAMILQYAMKNPTFVELISVTAKRSEPTDKHPDGILWTSLNQMMLTTSQYHYEGLKGVKTGTLPDENLRNFVSTASKDGYTYLLVILGAPIRDKDNLQYQKVISFVETAKLYDWAFSTFKVKTLMNIGEEVSEVGVRLSWDVDHIKLLAKEKFATLVPNDTTSDDVQPIVVFHEAKDYPVKGEKGKTQQMIDAPITKGTEVGYVKLMLAGEEVGRVPLVAEKSVTQSKALYYMDKVKGFFDTLLFKFLFSFLIIILVLYAVLMIIRNRNRRRYQSRRKRPPSKR